MNKKKKIEPTRILHDSEIVPGHLSHLHCVLGRLSLGNAQPASFQLGLRAYVGNHIGEAADSVDRDRISVQRFLFLDIRA